MAFLTLAAQCQPPLRGTVLAHRPHQRALCPHVSVPLS